MTNCNIAHLIHLLHRSRKKDRLKRVFLSSASIYAILKTFYLVPLTQKIVSKHIPNFLTIKNLVSDAQDTKEKGIFSLSHKMMVRFQNKHQHETFLSCLRRNRTTSVRSNRTNGEGMYWGHFQLVFLLQLQEQWKVFYGT